MKLASAIAIYLLFWAITALASLPFGVRTSRETGADLVRGQAESAPHDPMLGKKLIWSTVVATLLFALFYANYVNGWLLLEDIPGWKDSGPYRPG